VNGLSIVALPHGVLVMDSGSVTSPDAPSAGESADPCLNEEKLTASVDPCFNEGKQMVPESSLVGDSLVAGGATGGTSTTDLAERACLEQHSNPLPTSQSRARSSSRTSGQQQPEQLTELPSTDSAGNAESLPAGAAVIAVAGLQGATIARTRVASRPRSLSRPRVANLGGASTEIPVLADSHDVAGHGAGGHSEAMNGSKSPVASDGMPKSGGADADVDTKEPVLFQDLQGSTSHAVVELGVADRNHEAPNLLQEPHSSNDGSELGKEVEKGPSEIRTVDEVKDAEENPSPAKLNTPVANKADFDNSPKFVVPACEKADGTVGQSPRLPSMTVSGADVTWETGMDDILVESAEPLLHSEQAVFEADRAMFVASQGRPVVAKPWECGLQRRLLRLAFGSH